MKTCPLPDLDLARIAPLERDEKIRALKQMRLGWPPYSYNPMRRWSLEILNVQAGPLGTTSRVNWSNLAAEIARRCRSDAEEAANLAVAKALFDLADSEQMTGLRHDFFPLAIGVAHKVSYWLPAVISLEHQAIVPFIDPRRAKGLTARGRQFAFSVMHQRIRVADPDFAGVELCIIQLGSADDGSRVPKLHFAKGINLIDFDELDQMIRDTYEIWHTILNEREAEARKESYKRRGSLI